MGDGSRNAASDRVCMVTRVMMDVSTFEFQCSVSLLNAVIVLELLLWKETAHYFIMFTAWSPDFQPVYVISCDSIAFLDKAVFYLRKFNLSRLCFCMALRIFMYLSPSWEFFSLINSKRHGCIYFGFYYIK